MKHYLGIDLGGTFIKGGIVSENGEIVVADKVPTEADSGSDRIIENIARLSNGLIEKSGMKKSDIDGLGIGIPGMIDSQRGIVVYACNLGWLEFDVAAAVEAAVGVPVKIGNDANVAALGEMKFGGGKKYNNIVMVTLGTGVGGGIILDGKLIEGHRGCGAEIGHSVIVAGGEPCGCGRRGCLEAYASASALMRDTKRAMQKNPKSRMWEIGSLDAVSGKVPFDYYSTDKAAKTVVDNYISKLGCGLVNFANEYRPEAIVLGGGVCAQGDNLIVPLQKIMNEEVYAGTTGPEVKIVVATLGNDAGTLGAAALFM